MKRNETLDKVVADLLDAWYKAEAELAQYKQECDIGPHDVDIAAAYVELDREVLEDRFLCFKERLAAASINGIGDFELDDDTWDVLGLEPHCGVDDDEITPISVPQLLPFHPRFTRERVSPSKD